MKNLKNTHELKNGDVISFYGSTLRLKERRLYNSTEAHRLHDPLGFVTFRTDLVEHGVGLRRAEAEAWVVQGNSRAKWVVLEEGADQ